MKVRFEPNRHSEEHVRRAYELVLPIVGRVQDAEMYDPGVDEGGDAGKTKDSPKKMGIADE